MDISRIQVEGGFLDSIDLNFQSGLNVIIGARGTGKTSLIELIRFGLGAKSHTPDTEAKAVEHAKSILEDGEVTITLDDLFATATVTRTANDEHPRSTYEYTPPIVLSQTEIETIGLNATAKLNLIDSFVKDRSRFSFEKAELKNQIFTVYKEIHSIEAELNESAQYSEKLSSVEIEISKLIFEHEKFKTQSQESTEKYQELSRITDELTIATMQIDMLHRFRQRVDDWEHTIDSKLSQEWESLEQWDQTEESDPLKDFRPKYDATVAKLIAVQKEFLAHTALAEASIQNTSVTKEVLENKARTLRSFLETQNEGLGKISRQLGILQTERQRLITAIKLQTEKLQRLTDLRRKRDEYFNAFCKMVEQRSLKREEVARQLNRVLQPQIKIHVDRAVEFSGYIQALTNALRGSGIKYNDLSLVIAERVSPRELMECTDTQDFQKLSEIADIPKDRALRLLSTLKESGMAEIITTEIGDNIRLCLLDGDYKDTSSLSAGQRCTVILSIVLQHKDRTLVLDQPEDHLDNAFIADTVIHALKERGNNGQVIVATHNANIPVLGNASQVIHLTSDGKNGFIQTAKPLAHSKSISAITRVMEGGYEAFKARSEFYESDVL